MRSSLRLVSLALLSSACAPTPQATAAADMDGAEAGGAERQASSRWRYTIALDESLSHMALGLCIEGPPPRALVAASGSAAQLESARVRGGPALARSGERLLIQDLGAQGCVDLEIDLEAAVDAGGRQAQRSEQALMLSPSQWLWHPAQVPDVLDAQARFELPEGVHATLPWPRVPESEAPGSEVGSPGWLRLERSAFVWGAWAAFGRYEPLRFEAAQAHFEVAVLDEDHRASRADIERWITVAAESVATLYGRFPRDEVSVVVVPASGWGKDPVLFGMARRGGGASALLLLDRDAAGEALPGEWVAVHEHLHFTMPLVDEPWMAEGFVTYYTPLLRARRGVLGYGGAPGRGEDPEARQLRLAHDILVGGFRKASGRRGGRNLGEASENMRRSAAYRRVYWGGAALACDLDLRLRRAAHGERSLDDLMISMNASSTTTKRWSAAALFEGFDQEIARWFEAGELDELISATAVMNEHLEAESIPEHILALELEDLRPLVDLPSR
ncbi:hypothetical protein G6O69_12910 [Pseudenhygromyxa sp. WMMC2535]|uniref:hypothetical protein n=1 Tax=Pseudenhygromyxa sp. WMMC2535 TaxID=2712867 RepID=UPI0015570308|nr:hypothetical protein [Pseudenhygromyxa sp. WMMC2535]NVB38733.1 hypothetical protein [Pseudenhygromyxa sp. WMMC2535]